MMKDLLSLGRLVERWIDQEAANKEARNRRGLFVSYLGNNPDRRSESKIFLMYFAAL